jgi:cysteinyl-tRNA synthetase
LYIQERLLVEYQVEIRDRLGQWFRADGMTGSVLPTTNTEINTNIPCTLTADQVNELINQRTSARRERNFTLADKIRTELTQHGIEVLYCYKLRYFF